MSNSRLAASSDPEWKSGGADREWEDGLGAGLGAGDGGSEAGDDGPEAEEVGVRFKRASMVAASRATLGPLAAT